jgi:hypothetical protein
MSVVWGGRTYAVFGRNRWIALFFSCLGLVAIILDIVSYMLASDALFPMYYSIDWDSKVDM